MTDLKFVKTRKIKHYNRGQLLKEREEKSPAVGGMWVLSLARAPRPWRRMNNQIGMRGTTQSGKRQDGKSLIGRRD
jgi:hypothetical protein